MGYDTTECELEELLARWDELHERGIPVTAEELCEHRPELAEKLNKRIHVLEVMGSLLYQNQSGLSDHTSGPAHSSASSTLRFVDLHFHARGGLGEVYRAQNVEFERQVAIKFLSKKHAESQRDRRRFMREAVITARLENPGIVPIYAIGSDEEGSLCYAMRFIEGRTLKEVVDKVREADGMRQNTREWVRGRRTLLNHFKSACSTVAFAHSRGILHCDLKPGNIMLGAFDETLVVDWGSARSMTRDSTREPAVASTGKLDTDQARMETGAGSGTLGFMSPEYQSGRWEEVGPTSDVYSLGATLYYLLTGHPPYTGESWAEVLRRMDQGLFIPPRRLCRSIPKSLEAVCLKALAPEPGDRYASPAHLAQEIERSLADEPVSAWREPWWIRARRRLDRHRTSVAALFTAVLVGLAALAAIAVIEAHSNRNLAVKNQELRIANLRAERRVDLATQAIENFSKVVSENPELTGQPTMMSLRKRLLAVPLEYYRQLKADVEETQDASPATRTGLAKAIIGLASVTAEIDSQANALKSYEQAADLLDSLLRNDPSHVDRQVLLARVLGEISMIQRSSGSLDAARASLDRARQMQERLAQDHPSSVAYQIDLARTLDRLGRLIFTDNPNESLACFEQAIGVYRSLINSNASAATVEAKANMAFTYNHLGMLKRTTGHAVEAEDTFNQAIEIFEGVAKDQPENPMHRMNLGIAHYNRARRRMDRAGFERARDIQEAVVREHPSVVSFRESLALTYGNLGNVQRNAGQLDQSQASFERVYRIQQDLVAENPDVLRFRHDLALTEINIGTLKSDQHVLDESLPRYVRARALLGDLIRLRPDDVLERGAMVVACISHGDALSQLGRNEDALDAFREAIAQARTVFNGPPRPGADRASLVSSFHRFARLHRKLGQTAESVSTMQELRKFWKGSPGEVYEIARELARCATRVEGGRVACAAGQETARNYEDQAMDALRQAIQSGLGGAERIATDPDFASLRTRADFRALMMDISFPHNLFER